MQDIDTIKEKIKKLYESGAPISICVHSSIPKVEVDGASVFIKGVYKNLFTVEAIENGLKKIYTVPYADVFIGKVKILELEKAVG